MGFEAPGGFRIPVLRGVSILRHADCMTTTTLINNPVGTVTNPRAVERLIAGQPTSDSAGVKLLIDVYAATIPTYRHEPKLHVNHQTVLRIKDGLPKMKDLPKEMGGLGEALPSSPLRGGMTAH